MRWIETRPITIDLETNPCLASQAQVELVSLGFGLTFRGIWIAQFPGNYPDVPAYILNSPYEFSEYEQLSRIIKSLITGYKLL